ncbi:MAG TPA: ABC transporter permease, partial [Candidatus Limnocylindria bacterium]
MAAPLDHVAAIAPPVADEGWLHRRGPGWLVVMGKEMAEGLTSLRFTIVLALLALAAAAPVYAASGAIRDAAEGASGVAALFLALFTIGADPVPSFVALVGFVAPLLGIAFGFDAINGERAQGTLPRLLSQPIHRDDVINGKFAAGLGVIALVVVVMILGVTSFALIRLGVVPEAVELLRIILWILVTLTYIALWLAFGLLLSFFGGLIVSLINGVVAPLTATSGEDILKNVGVREMLQRLLP